MKLRTPALFLAFLLPALAAAQAPAAAPAPKAFDVASIKESASLVGATQASAGVHVDGAQVHCALLSVRDYIRVAYKVQDYQISGPDWMASTRYDIDAKLPSGASKDDVPAMLQTLLADRFGLQFHTESKDLPVYLLQVAKGGVKMQALPANPEGNLDIKKSMVNADAKGDINGTIINFGNGSSVSITMADHTIAGTKITLDNLANVLARFEDRPVVDRTGLTGIYNVTLTPTPEDFQILMISAARAQGVALPPQALAMLDGASQSSLHDALEKLGLTMDGGKAPVAMTMVDQIHKPVAN